MENVIKDHVPVKKIDNISKIIGTGPENIKVIKNFLRLEKIYYFLNIAESYKNIVSNKAYWQLHDHFLLECKDELKKYKEIITLKAEELYGLKLNRDKDLEITVHPIGSYMDPHTDIIDYKSKEAQVMSSGKNFFLDQEKDFPYFWDGHLSILVYLNKNFDGGVLYFPDHNIEIKPEPGTLVMFPSNLHYLHGVTKVLNHERYTLSLKSRFSDFKNYLKDEND